MAGEWQFYSERQVQQLIDANHYLNDVVDDLRRQLEQKDGVIEALQQNIADLTSGAGVGSSSDKWGPAPTWVAAEIAKINLADYVTGYQSDLPATKPAIPAAALTPAKLPRFF